MAQSVPKYNLTLPLVTYAGLSSKCHGLSRGGGTAGVLQQPPVRGGRVHLLPVLFGVQHAPFFRHLVKMVQIYFYSSAYTSPVLILQEEKQTAWHACSSHLLSESLPAGLRQLLGQQGKWRLSPPRCPVFPHPAQDIYSQDIRELHRGLGNWLFTAEYL